MQGIYNLTFCDGKYQGYCGTQNVPLDRYDASPLLGTIPIGFEFFRRKSAGQPSKGLLTPQEGGPGYSTIGSKNDYLRVFQPLRDEGWDIMLMDKRGTGKSHAINCPFFEQAQRKSPKNVGACSKHWNTSYYYSTLSGVKDLVEVVNNLGYDKLSYYGDSYGTMFGQVLAATFPDKVNAMVLDSAYPMRGDNQDFEMTQGISNLDIVCSRSPSCPWTGEGSSTKRLAAVLAGLRQNKLRGRGVYGINHTRQMCEIELTPGSLPGVFLNGVGEGYSVWREMDSANRALLSYLALIKKWTPRSSTPKPSFQDYAAPLLRLVAETNCGGGDGNYTDFSQAINIGLDCQEWNWPYDMRRSPSVRQQQFLQSVATRKRKNPKQFQPFTIDEIVNAQGNPTLWNSCVYWASPPPGLPVSQYVPPSAGFQGVKFPVLVVNGELDTATSPVENTQCAAQFPKEWVQHVMLVNMVHEVLVFSGAPTSGDLAHCASPNINQFFRASSFDGIDWSCAAKVRPVRVVPVFAVTLDQLQGAAMPTYTTGLVGAEKNDDEYYGFAASASARELSADSAFSPAQLTLRLSSVAIEAAGDALVRVHSSKGPGLRGGSFSVDETATGQLIKLSAVRWTTDSIVSGALEWNQNTGLVSGNLTAQTRWGKNLRKPCKIAVTVTWIDTHNNAHATIAGTGCDNKHFSVTRVAP